jgi:hypothetical protein
VTTWSLFGLRAAEMATFWPDLALRPIFVPAASPILGSLIFSCFLGKVAGAVFIVLARFGSQMPLYRAETAFAHIEFGPVFVHTFEFGLDLA